MACVESLGSLIHADLLELEQPLPIAFHQTTEGRRKFSDLFFVFAGQMADVN